MHVLPRQGLGRRLAIFAATGGLVLGAAGIARADIVYNTLDADIDATHEVMNLTFPGPDGSTTLEIQTTDDDGKHGCNIPGGINNSITLAATFDATVASVSFVDDDATFTNCGDVVHVVVTPEGVGSTAVEFTIDWDNSGNTPSDGSFELSQAAFTVNVTAGDDGNGGGEVCDVDPAAPAWANAILRANDVKNKTTQKNTISSVAKHMGEGATFDGIAKNAHPEYENAVFDHMNDVLGLGLSTGPADAARPGWECTEVPA